MWEKKTFNPAGESGEREGRAWLTHAKSSMQKFTRKNEVKRKVFNEFNSLFSQMFLQPRRKRVSSLALFFVGASHCFACCVCICKCTTYLATRRKLSAVSWIAISTVRLISCQSSETFKNHYFRHFCYSIKYALFVKKLIKKNQI